MPSIGMSSAIVEHSRHWQERAAEFRALAETVKGQNAKRTMLRIAEDYVRLASHGKPLVEAEPEPPQPEPPQAASPEPQPEPLAEARPELLAEAQPEPPQAASPEPQPEPPAEAQPEPHALPWSLGVVSGS
jgi:outer membrane biosynthesis protein TonB